MTLFAFSATSSIALLVAALASSSLPSRCRSLSHVTSPTASFSRPFIYSPLCPLNAFTSFGKTLCYLTSLYPFDVHAPRAHSTPNVET